MLNLIDILSSVEPIFDLEIKHGIWVFLIVKCKSSDQRHEIL